MSNQSIPRRICNSWYHHKWFRVLLVFIGIDLFILGVTFALGINLLVFFAGITGAIIRVIFGILYILIAGYLIKHGLYYKKATQESYMLCQHCAHQMEEE